MEKIIYTLIVAGIGGMIGIKLKIPAGALVGAMVFVAIYNIWSGKGYIPTNFKLVAQIMVGGMLGLNFTMETIHGLKAMLIPAVIMVLGLMVLNLLLGFLLYKTTGLNLITALFSSAPGGLTEMVLTSEAYGADTSKVALLHLMRLISVITILPLVIKGFIKIMHV
ncbi:AbrB family transcriptional regulator [Clostridiaceae bacterium 35-E11]